MESKTSTPHIYFKARKKEFRKLSNLYGGVECAYMALRFNNERVRSVICSFDTLDEESFKRVFAALYPKGNPQSWIFEQGIARGILAKLVGSLWKLKDAKPSRVMRKRGEAFASMCGISYDQLIESIEDDIPRDAKLARMKQCLCAKFNIPEYRDLLLSTGNATLHEQAGRGKPDLWTVKGEDRLGILLMEIREEFVQIDSSFG